MKWKLFMLKEQLQVEKIQSEHISTEQKADTVDVLKTTNKPLFIQS